MRASALAIAALALGPSCAYHFGSMENSRTFHGAGYDSGLAYGTAVQSAISQGVASQPKAVEMNCLAYVLKPMIAGGGGVALSHADKFDGGTIAVALLGAAILILSPNCFATLHFDATPAVSPPSDRALPPAAE